MSPLATLQSLIDQRRATYASFGLSNSVHGRCYCTIWGVPSSEILCRGHGHTVEDAARNALLKIAAPLVVTLPGWTTR